MTSRALLLAMSSGLGGGIERYVATLECVFASGGVESHRLDLRGPGLASHLLLLKEARIYLRSNNASTRLILAHPNLLPVASMLGHEGNVGGISVVCHGCEVWGRRLRPRRYLDRLLMRRAGVRVVAASGFTSGALADSVPTAILPPGLSQEWFDTLVKASANETPAPPGVTVVTAFRLEDWRDKGLPQLLDAVRALSRPEVRVVVCGSGAPPAALLRLLSNYESCSLRPGLSDGELAHQLASADLFVLATRTRAGRQPFGEGFGLVLLEAQLAGTAVVGPAYGGSHDAFVEGVTGVAPADESAGTLAGVLGELLSDPHRLDEMGREAGEWARKSFAPDLYASRAVAKLL
jgi:phosphatidyl-myo-inositol dimannoside synthase